jgi:hypothetical protein
LGIAGRACSIARFCPRALFVLMHDFAGVEERATKLLTRMAWFIMRGAALSPRCHSTATCLSTQGFTPPACQTPLPILPHLSFPADNAGFEPPRPKVLIANRGEIAVRVIRTCKMHDIDTIAVYTEPDALAPHVRQATTAVLLGKNPREYTNAEKLLQVRGDRTRHIKLLQ